MLEEILYKLLDGLLDTAKLMGVLVGCCIGLFLIWMAFYCPVSSGLRIYRAGRDSKSPWKLFLGIIVLILPFVVSALWFLHVYGWGDFWTAYATLYCLGLLFIWLHASQVWSDAKKFHSWPVMIIGGIEFVSPFALLFGIRFNPGWAVGLMVALPFAIIAHSRLLRSRTVPRVDEMNEPSHR